MPSKKVLSRCTKITNSWLAKTQAKDWAPLIPVGASTPLLLTVVSMEQFNLLFQQVQNLTVAVQAIQATAASLLAVQSPFMVALQPLA